MIAINIVLVALLALTIGGAIGFGYQIVLDTKRRAADLESQRLQSIAELRAVQTVHNAQTEELARLTALVQDQELRVKAHLGMTSGGRANGNIFGKG